MGGIKKDKTSQLKQEKTNQSVKTRKHSRYKKAKISQTHRGGKRAGMKKRKHQIYKGIERYKFKEEK